MNMMMVMMTMVMVITGIIMIMVMTGFGVRDTESCTERKAGQNVTFRYVSSI
jgi:hypothetical protein